MKAKYIDIHSHRVLAGPDVLTLRSYYRQFAQMPAGVPCSAGLHPWYLQDWLHHFSILEQVVAQPHVLAIGECGLDKLCATDWQMQLSAFTEQVKLAAYLRKPLIIHCVRAYDEVRQILTRLRPGVPVIFHGFNKSSRTADVLVNDGHYLSFGAALLQPNTSLSGVLANIRADSFFLETDDDPAQIEAIYAKAAEIRKVSKDAIILQVQKNFKSIFKLQ